MYSISIQKENYYALKFDCSGALLSLHSNLFKLVWPDQGPLPRAGQVHGTKGSPEQTWAQGHWGGARGVGLLVGLEIQLGCITQTVGQLWLWVSSHLEVFVIVKDPPIKAIDPGVAGVGRVVDHRGAAWPAPVGDVVDGGGPHGYQWSPMRLCLLSSVYTRHSTPGDDACPVLVSLLSPSPHYLPRSGDCWLHSQWMGIKSIFRDSQIIWLLAQCSLPLDTG